MEFLRSNPGLANLGPNNSSSSTTALQGFFKPGDNQSKTFLRSSASSAALSMLTNYASLNAAEPSLTAFDTNLKSILVLLENAHVFPATNIYPFSESRSITRAITNPPLLLSYSATPPRPSIAQPRPKVPFTTTQSTAPLTLQSQLLHSLATPYMDADLPSPATTSLFHPLASKFSSNQSIFTTSATPPYTILTGNEMGCLVFGMSKSEIRKLNIIDLIGASHKESLKAKITATSNTVFLCGEVMPITKYNGQSGYSSFWAKSHGSGIITWVIEEVVYSTMSLTVHLKTGIVQKKIDKDNLLPPVFEKLLIHDVVSGLSQDLDSIKSLEHHVTISDGKILPCAVILSQEQHVSTVSLEIITLPHIAGVVLIDTESYNIEDYNQNFFSNLFGYSSQDNCRGWNVDDIIPHFSSYLGQIADICSIDRTTTGLVLPEHLFRKMAAQRESVEGGDSNALFIASKGISGLHKDGHLITLDVQVRGLGGTSLALWITYSHSVKGARSTTVPSQLTLLSMKKKVHRPSVSRAENSILRESPSLPKLNTAFSSSTTPSQPTTPTSPKTSKKSFDYTRTPREQIMHSASESASPASPYFIHIPELGARRRQKKLEDFNILQKMGEGAYGKVLLAEYKEEPHLKVVLKCVIKERILVDAWTRDRKLGTIPSEIKILAALNKGNHENILQLLDFFEDDQFYHIETEPHGSPATDLFDLIDLQPRMPEAKCRNLFRQVVSAVRHLHSLDIVHRDLKDENIIVDGLGRIKVIDFGSAAFVKQGPFDVFVGTIDYAAPETLAGKPYAGKPQDVWSLGILLYTIVFKENPFYSADEIMGQEGVVEPDLQIPFEVSEGCLDLMKRILTREVSARLTIEQVWEHPWLNS